MTADANATNPTLASKLVAVMADVGYVEKKGFNSFHKYKYVTEADLIEAVRGKLAACNVMLLTSVTAVDERTYQTDKGKQSCVTTVRLKCTFIDGDSAEQLSAEWAGAGDDPADKGLYKAYTGALKYFLMKTFMIATGDDPENDHATDARAQEGMSSNGRVLTQEQYQGILDAFQRAGNPADELAVLLARFAIPGEAAGETLSLSQRVALLPAGQALEVQKALAALPAVEGAAA